MASWISQKADVYRPVLLVCADSDQAIDLVRTLDHSVRDHDSLTIVVPDVHAGLDVLAERRLSLTVVADPCQAVAIQQLQRCVPGLAIVSIVDEIGDVGLALEAGAHQHVLTDSLNAANLEHAMDRAMAICSVDHHAPDDETVDTLLALLAHHLREPIRSARLYNDRATLAGRQTQWHDRIEDVLAHADLLTTSLLNYLRLDAHEVGPVRTVDLGMVEEQLRAHYGELGATPSTLTWALDGTVRCQPESLVEILRLVVDNALIFSGKDLPTVDVSTSHAKGHALIRVTDCGPGISSVNRERAFRPLERLTDESPGVGMGLAMARRLAGLADGDLFIQPGTSGGTTVVLRLQATEA